LDEELSQADDYDFPLHIMTEKEAKALWDEDLGAAVIRGERDTPRSTFGYARGRRKKRKEKERKGKKRKEKERKGKESWNQVSTIQVLPKLVLRESKPRVVKFACNESPQSRRG
jgi:hypothetical protein